MNENRSPARTTLAVLAAVLGLFLLVSACSSGAADQGAPAPAETETEAEAPAASGTPTEPGESAFSTREQAQRIYAERVEDAGIVPALMPAAVAGEAGSRICVNLYDGRAPADLGRELQEQYGLTDEQAGTMLGSATASFCENRTPTEENFFTGTPPE